MGLDGGTKMSRSDVLRGSSWKVANQDNTRSTRGGSVSQSGPSYKEETISKEDAALMAYTTCALSDEPLRAPVVADYLGRLFNREAVLEFLLAKRKDYFVDKVLGVHRLANTLRVAEGALDNLNSLKDVFTVILPEATDLGKASGSGAAASTAPLRHLSATGAGSNVKAPYYCPITQLPCTRYPFSALPTCGHIFSDRALNSLKQQECPTCSTPYKETVSINPSKDQLEQMTSRLVAKASLKGKASKRKRQEAAPDSSCPPETSSPHPAVLCLEGPKAPA